MRIVPLGALITVSSLLAACGGGGGGTDTDLSSVGLDCGLNCTIPDKPDTGTTDTGTTTPPAPPTNTGNTTVLSTGDVTLALESTNLISPAGGSLSNLKRTTDADGNNVAQFNIDTKTASNSEWPKAKILEERTEWRSGPTPMSYNANYALYRAYDSGTMPGHYAIDEELQVWDWGDSYATQYRNLGGSNGGSDAPQQAWSFGGNATADASMPTGGASTYTGYYGATAKTWNYIDRKDNPDMGLSANNSWQVSGTSSITVDFGNKKMSGTLTPTAWTAEQTLNQHTGRVTVSATDTTNDNFKHFMNDAVVLTGTLSGSKITGNALMDKTNGWVSEKTPMYAGIFGDTANQVTGVFDIQAVEPTPNGPDVIADDRRGYIQESGFFNASK